MSGENTESPRDGDSNILGPGSYTSQRLKHATPQHLHLTSRRCFIGPIPEGWLKSHRKEWYMHYLHINYSSRAATFSTTANYSHLRQISGLEGPSVSAVRGQSLSFPQPEDVEVEEDSGQSGEEDSQETDGPEEPTAVQVPRATGASEDADLQGKVAGSGAVGNAQAAESSALKLRRQSSASDLQPFVTAKSSTKTGHTTDSAPDTPKAGALVQIPSANGRHPDSTASSRTAPESNERPSSSVQGVDTGKASNSTASLLQHRNGRQGSDKNPTSILAKTNRGQSSRSGRQEALRNAEPEPESADSPAPTGLVRFNMPQEDADHDRQKQEQLAKLSHRRTLRQRRKGKQHAGEIVKAERMLVRVDTTAQQLSDDFDENESMRVETKTIEKWREFIIVCRESSSDEADLVLQLYKTRVIPAVQHSNTSKQTNHVIPLKRKSTRANLYSSLDKTLAVWVPFKRGSKIYLMRPRSSTSSVEWYTYIRNALGWNRSTEVQINVPDLSLALKIENPFAKLEAQRDALRKADSEVDDKAILQTMIEERAVAGDIVKRCMGMLDGAPEWADVLDTWSTAEKIGLAWKRYDRLEWVHGANEQKMYGTIAMQKSHDLELRPKRHYPTKTPITIDVGKDVPDEARGTDTNESDQPSLSRQGSVSQANGTADEDTMTEPPPVEGFLIRLTSQRGRDQRLGRMFYKRLYFSSHNQYLTFCRPAKGIPPPPPKLSLTPRSNIPTTREIVDKMPLVYGVAPFALNEQGDIKWLSPDRPQDQIMHDHDAFDEGERQVNTLLQADGYVDLCNVQKVRSIVRGSTPVDQHVDHGNEVDFHQEVNDSQQDDGTTEVFDDGRTFELVMRNGLIVRLEAFDKDTKREWILRLRELTRYWQLRSAADLDLMKAVRQSNLDKLHITEELESYLGQFGQKWEVSQAIASAELYNMCAASSCRSVTISGNLFRKPRRHSTFKRCSVILCHGQLLVFQSSLRKRTGEEIPLAHHERQVAIDLRDCYVYSGLVTEGDLLYQNQTFDSNNPGGHALPRVYMEDGWTSTDEDTTTCFVVWQGRRKSLFRANEEEVGGKKARHLRAVAQLGVPGRSIVFKTRSRAERDHWVMNVGLEIERLQQGEEIRVVSK